MNMFRKNIVLFSGLLLLSGCQNDEDKDFVDSDEFNECTVVCEGIQANELKTTVTNKPGTMDYSQVWNIGDCFAVRDNETDKKANFQKLEGEENFRKVEGSMGKPTESHVVYGYYPSTGMIDRIEAGKFAVTLPQEQHYVSGSTLATDLYPMFCKTTSTTFTFKNVAAIICINLKAKDDNTVVKSVSLSSSAANMSGDAVISLDANDNPVLEMGAVAGEPLPATIVCTEGVKLKKDAATPFHIIIPPYAYPAGSIKIKVATTTNICTYNVTTDFDVKRSSGNRFTKNLTITLGNAGEGQIDDIAD